MILPFGKYKGLNIADAPTAYLEWLAGWEPLREPLKGRVVEELKKRERTESKISADIDTEMAHRIISSGVRQLAKIFHPDAGGDCEAMKKVNTTADRLREVAGI